MEQKKEKWNTVKYDEFAGFHPAKAYTNFSDFFIQYLADHPNFKPTKKNLQSDEFELAFQYFAKSGTRSDDLIDTILSDIQASKKFVNKHQGFEVFKNASELYKVIKCDKYGHWIKAVDHIWYQNKITNNLTKQIDENTQKQLAAVYDQNLQTYINEYLTSHNSKFCKAFDNMLWWLNNIKKGNIKGCSVSDYKDLRRIFYAFQRQGIVKSGKNNVTFKDLYNRPSDKELSKIGSSDSYKEFTKLLQSLNLCNTFGAKAHEFLYENISYNEETKQYEVVPPKSPNKFPFTESEVDKYLLQIEDIKSKLPKEDQKDFVSSDAIMLQTNDKRLAGMNTSTFGEYLVMLKAAYQFGVTPQQVWEACIQNYNNPDPGNQWIRLPSGDLIKFNTKLDINLNGMYTATGGHADIEILSKVPGKKDTYNYSIFEPTVYDTETQTHRQEQDGILHILANRLLNHPEIKINKTSFNLVSFFDSDSLVQSFTETAVGKYWTYPSHLPLKINCYKYSTLSAKCENLPKKLNNEKYYKGSLTLKSIVKGFEQKAEKHSSKH